MYLAWSQGLVAAGKLMGIRDKDFAFLSKSSSSSDSNVRATPERESGTHPRPHQSSSTVNGNDTSTTQAKGSAHVADDSHETQSPMNSNFDSREEA